jgi:hypothetical protein
MTDAQCIVSETRVEKNGVTAFPGEAVADLVRAPYRFSYGMEIDLREIPMTILQVPFLLNLVPTLWATGKNYRIDSMDEDLYFCLDAVQEGFKTLYPQIQWTGKITPDNLEKNVRISPKTRFTQVLFFSGGVDSTWSALRCNPENTVLLAVRGHDIGLDKDSAWEKTWNGLGSFARDEGFTIFPVHANVFRSLRYGSLHRAFPSMKPWYGTVQHGLALSSLAFPAAYHEGWDSALFSSSVPLGIGDAPWGSHFLIEPNVRVGGSRILYFGAELEWSEKVFSIVEDYSANPGKRKPSLRVCLDGMSGEATSNCCRCEKCLRAIASLVVCGENPSEWGFGHCDPLLENAGEIFSNIRIPRCNAYHWRRIKKTASERLDAAPRELSPLLSLLARWDLSSHLF